MAPLSCASLMESARTRTAFGGRAHGASSYLRGRHAPSAPSAKLSRACASAASSKPLCGNCDASSSYFAWSAVLLPLQRWEVVRSELADGAGTNQDERENAPPISCVARGTCLARALWWQVLYGVFMFVKKVVVC